MQQHLTEQYQKHKKSLIGFQDAWMVELREQALAYFIDQGLPSNRNENYKYTNLSKLNHTSYHLAPCENALTLQTITQLAIDKNHHLLVFINGYFSAAHSQILAHDNGIYISNLASALKEKNQVIAQYLGKQISLENSITALNTVLHQDGAVIILDKNAQLKQPIELLFLQQNSNNSMQHVRNLIVCEPGSQATVIEHHASIDHAEYLKTVVTEVSQNANSHLTYYLVQNESNAANHLSQLDVQQQKDSICSYLSLDIGGKLVRHDVNMQLLAANANCQLNGLYLANDKQHIDNHTTIAHVSAHCQSQETFKGIVDDKARGVFNGRVIVHKGAIKSVAEQNNANLLLSNDAEVDTKPQLEIFNDDVKCTHGATVGQLDEQALFYLQSRGIPLAQARTMLTFGFAENLITSTTSTGVIRDKLLALIARKLHNQAGEHNDYSA